MIPAQARRRQRAWFWTAAVALPAAVVAEWLNLPGAWLSVGAAWVGVLQSAEWGGWLRGWRERGDAIEWDHRDEG